MLRMENILLAIFIRPAHYIGSYTTGNCLVVFKYLRICLVIVAVVAISLARFLISFKFMCLVVIHIVFLLGHLPIVT